MISIVIPCYNEEQAIDLYLREMSIVEENMKIKYNETFEYIFIDDGSTDNTLAVLKRNNVKYISFSRNFGKEAGIYAGMKAAKGDYTAVMDVDLQDPPSMLEQMYVELKHGDYDCVAAKRSTRKGEPPIRSFCARCFYKFINAISTTEIVDGARDYRLMSRKMVDSILSLKEYNRFSKGLFSWVGFKTKWLEYENIERAAGTTKWSFWKLFIYSLDGIMAFSVTPLAISSLVGIFLCAVSIIMIGVFIFKTLIWGDPVSGYPSLVCIIFFLSGIQLFCTGIIGQYIAKMYLEVKGRPIYIIKEDNIY